MTVKQLSASVLPAFPLLLLLLALSTMFLFGNDRGYFYRYGDHNGITGKQLAVAANLSPAHNFLGFYRQTLNNDGAPTYDVYNRFPIGGYLLIKLAMLPFGDDLSAQLYAARLLMLLFFAATAVLAYLSLARLTAHRWIALTATLLTFSSSYCLYYNDVVTTDGCPDLFGVFLVFHGMVLFVQEGRFRQLLVKTCLALLLGWHVYALLLPFVVLGLAGALVKARSGGINSLEHLTHVTTSLLRSRYLALGVVALLFGTAVLSVNFANEYFALNGATGLTDLPSVQSMLRRTGQNEALNALNARQLAWPSFLKLQFYRIGGMSLPSSLIGRDIHDPYRGAPLGLQYVIGILGIVVSGTCLIWVAFVRRQILWATLVLSGFCWGLPMRHFTAFPYHNFEGLFYIGLPLVLFSFTLLSIHRLFGRRPVIGLSVAALVVFVLSGFQMAHVGPTAEAAERQKSLMADMEVIRKKTTGKMVLVQTAYNLVRYALAGTGTMILTPRQLPLPSNKPTPTSKSRSVDFFITPYRHEETVLTPANRHLFLYDSTHVLNRRIDPIPEGAEALLHAAYREHAIDVYLSDNRLYYVRRPRRDVAAFLDQHTPMVGKPFQARLSTPLPHTRPWQWERGSNTKGWTAVADGSSPSDQYLPSAADVGARLRAHVDYVDGTGQWVRASTEASNPVVAASIARVPESHREPQFFLHVIPVDVNDLPARRKRWKFDNLDFHFSDSRIPHGKRDVAVRELPPYDVARIRTGQFIWNNQLWKAEVSFEKEVDD